MGAKPYKFAPPNRCDRLPCPARLDLRIFQSPADLWGLRRAPLVIAGAGAKVPAPVLHPAAIMRAHSSGAIYHHPDVFALAKAVTLLNLKFTPAIHLLVPRSGRFQVRWKP